MRVHNASTEVLFLYPVCYEDYTRLDSMLVANPQCLITAYEALMNCDGELKPSKCSSVYSALEILLCVTFSSI